MCVCVCVGGGGREKGRKGMKWVRGEVEGMGGNTGLKDVAAAQAEH